MRDHWPLFVVLTPVIGTCFCICRCCENCGGEMHQRQRKNADCRRAVYTASLIATSIFIVLGVLISYAANHNVSAQVKSTRRFINTNLRDLKTLANNTPSQIEYLTAQYTTSKNKVLSDLDNIGPLLGGRIQNQLEKDVVPSLDTALRMAGAKVESAIKAMRETKEALESVGSSLEVLQEGTSNSRTACLESEPLCPILCLTLPAPTELCLPRVTPSAPHLLNWGSAPTSPSSQMSTMLWKMSIMSSRQTSATFYRRVTHLLMTLPNWLKNKLEILLQLCLE
ncbi:hypothetical protein WMY93_005523 [Mugilogobius chulae]|uniref:Uncharacterized protein n=1 Tax=Mugilogobius chulae TaxID=88201 RepID=A0AAW0PNJ4_9GOBI